MKKTFKKIFILVLMVLVFSATVNVNGATGYTYDSDGKVIYSTEGMTVNQTPRTYIDLGITYDTVTQTPTPSDLYVYTDGDGESTIYLTDSKLNGVYVFDETLDLKQTINYVYLNPENIHSTSLLAVKSNARSVFEDQIAQFVNDYNSINSSKLTNSTFIEATDRGLIEFVNDLEMNEKYKYIYSFIEELTDDSSVKDAFKLCKEKALTDETEDLVRIKVELAGFLSRSIANSGDITSNDYSSSSIEAEIFNYMNEATLPKIYLNSPSAVYRAITPSIGLDLIYICDKGNNQVVILDASTYSEETGSYEIYQVVTKPTDELDASVSFSPKKVITDGAGRIYVIADNVTDGIMQFSVNGEFDRYTGTNKITLTAWEIFWLNFSTEEQRMAQKTFYNTTFTGMCYKNEMIYTTSYSILNKSGTVNDTIMVKKINPTGIDVLRRNGYKEPKGDVTYSKTSSIDSSDSGPSTFESITVNDYGVYSVVDSKRGRIFTYDNEGNLLYISGGKGTQADRLSNPVAIQYLGEDLLVLDAMNNTVVRFEPTEIATYINQAVYETYNGRIARKGIAPVFKDTTQTWWIDDVDTGIDGKDKTTQIIDGYWYIGDAATGIKEEALAAADYWEMVVSLNSNYEIGYIGIGRKYNQEKNYEEAMKYFKLGADRVYYSKAFKQYRDGIIRRWFAPVVVTLAALLLARYVYKTVRNKKLGIKKQEETGMGDE